MSKLKINRDLIDSDFPGYKLSLDSLPLYSIEHELDLDIPVLTDNQYSYQHAKAFGVHNHLFSDQWSDSSTGQNLLYFIDNDLRILSFCVHQGTRDIPSGKVVYELDAQTICGHENRVAAVVDFVSLSLAVITDGCGNLIILETGLRGQQETWKLLFKCAISKTNSLPSKLVDCVFVPNDLDPNNVDLATIDCVCTTVEPRDESRGDGSSRGNFYTSLNWLTLGKEENGVWTVQRTRILESSSPPDYVTLPLALGCRNRLVISSEKSYTFVYDSLIKVEPDIVVEAQSDEEMEEITPAYTWSQTDEDITALFTLPSNKCNKSFIAFKLATDHIELSIKGGDSLLCGELPENVDVQSSNWLIEGQRLELTLEKKEAGMWPLIVCGDTTGKLCLSEKQADVIHSRLEQMAAESDDTEFKKPAYNAQELEECDIQTTDGASLMCFHGDTHKVLSQTDLSGDKWLFNSLPERASHEETTNSSVARRPAICIRHDVDGLILECSDSAPLWEHTKTFNAFGYVTASKSKKKFTGCAPDFSYSAIFENVKHIYIYWRETSVQTSLRNRKTGIPVIARQQLISLPPNKHEELESIMGIHLENKRLFILTNNILHMVQMTS